MAKDLSTAEFLRTMKRTPIGSDSSLTLGEANLLAKVGVDVNKNSALGDEQKMIQEEKESTTFWDNLWGGISNLTNAFGVGFANMFEGIVDVGATIVGNVVDLFGGDSTKIRNFIETDYSQLYADYTSTFMSPFNLIRMTGDSIITHDWSNWEGYWKDWIEVNGYGLNFNPLVPGITPFLVSEKEMQDFREEYYASSYVLDNSESWVAKLGLGVAQGAGQLVGQYLGGKMIGNTFGLSQRGTQNAALALMGASSTGSGVESALDEGANLQQASLYGLLSGATETVTELIGGVGTDVGSGLIGKTITKYPATRKIFSSLPAKIAGGFISEGLEEVLSDVADPLWQKVTYRPDMSLSEEYGSKDFTAGLISSFVVGGILGGFGEGVKYYRIGKTEINGKKIGQKAALSYDEWNESKNVFDTASKNAFDDLQKYVNKYDINIQEGTSILDAFNQVIQNERLTESERKSLERKFNKLSSLSDSYLESQDRFLNDLESRGITEEDLNIEYQRYNEQQMKDVANEVGVSVKVDENSDIAYLDKNGTVVVNDTNSSSDIYAFATMEDLESSDRIVFEKLNDNLSTIAQQTLPNWQQTIERLTQMYSEQGFEPAQAQERANQTLNAQVLSNLVKERPDVLQDSESLNSVIEILTSDNITLREAQNEIQYIFDTYTPDTTKRHQVKGKEIAIIKKQPYSAGFQSLANKFLDDSFAIRTFLKNVGLKDSEVNSLIRKVRAQSGITKNIIEDGFVELNQNYELERKTAGLYNGKNGIVDLIYQNADSQNLDRTEHLALVEEALSLQDERDRQKVGKTVFGYFYNYETLTDEELNNLKTDNEELYNRIIAGNTISESEFLQGTNGTYTGALITDEQIDTRLEEIRKIVTNYNEIERLVYEYNDYLLNLRVEAGQITEDQKQQWKEEKPHYVPEFRVFAKQTSNIDLSSTIIRPDFMKAKGSNIAIQDIFLSMEAQTKAVESFKSFNDLLLAMYDSSIAAGIETEDIQLVERTPLVFSTDQSLEISRTQTDGMTVYAYRNGERLEFRVSPEIAESLKSLHGDLKNISDNSVLLRAMRKVASLERRLMTSLSVGFSWWRNPIKDIQSAVIYSKNGTGTFLRNWGKAFTQVVGKSNLFEVYETLSGQNITIKDSNTNPNAKSFYADAEIGTIKKTIRNIATHYENAMEIMEHTTRFAEFISSLDRYQKEGLSYKKAVDLALVDAQEVTLNFSRKGTVTTILNQYVPFLTANIEACARNIRAFISPKSAKEWAALILRMLLLGIAPQLIQEMIYANDEDYHSLSDTMRSNYYLIKVGGKFIRIPKGYLQQAFAADVVLATKKNVTVDDIKSAVSANWNAIGLDVSGVFFQPIIDAKYNTTWYGGEIVGQEWDNTRPANQYTSSTSEISKFIGKMLNVSPLKVDYVLDQMTGVVGDIVLPLTAKSRTSVFDFVKGQFITDPAYKNRYASDFYNYKEELNFNKTDGDIIAKAVLSYMNRATQEISDLKELQVALENDASLSQKEKNEQDRIYQVMRNACYKQALANAKKLSKALENYELSDVSYNTDYREAIRESLGAETALKICCSEKVYKKAQSYAKLGVSYDSFYVYYFNMHALPDRDSIENYIVRLRVSPQIKNLLYALMGYNIGKEKEKVLELWLKKKGLSKEEIALLL